MPSGTKQSKKYLAMKESKAKKMEANKRQLAMKELCVGWKVYKAGWKICCWKVCWWQLAMAGLCGVVEWAMESAYAHLVSTSGVLGFALSLL